MNIRSILLAGLGLLLLASSACAGLPSLPAESVPDPAASLPEEPSLQSDHS